MQAEQTDGQRPMEWSDVDWTTTEAVVRRIQDRIFRAAKADDGAKVKNLQKLLVRSRSAKLLAIRQVTQQNAGRHTPGIDGVVCKTPEDRVALLESGLDLKGYKPKPVRRVYIPKANGKLRPLGIPTVKDRVMQAVVKLALEPEWEPRFEANSHGFRPGRCTMDAIEAIYNHLAKRGASRWILDADITGCFDNIAHGPLLAKLPTFTRTIERWLKAGAVELGDWRENKAGTPQGGIISPLLANIALDGLERLFDDKTRTGNYIPPSRKKGDNRGVSLIRYADDVRHITWRWIPFAERKGLEEMTLGPAAYLMMKVKGDISMPSKRERSEDAYGRVPQGPRDMVRTGLFKPQPPAMQAYIPRHSVLCRGHCDRTAKSSPSEPSTRWAMGRRPIQGSGRGTYVALDTSSIKGMWDRPTRCEAQGDGAAIVLRGRESRPHGEGRQVS